MHILHFSTADNEGGSGRSAYRIHSGLRKLGYTSRMLVGKKVTDDPDVALVAGNFLGRMTDLFFDRYNRLRGHQYLHVPSSKKLPEHPWVQEADIIQLFNTHGGYFSHTILPELSGRAHSASAMAEARKPERPRDWRPSEAELKNKAPIVWRLSDMWPMTAHSAYTYGCECYKKGPDECICKLNSYPPIYKNTTRMLWDIKEKIYSQSNLTIVAPSRFMETATRKSILLSRFPIHYIPNGINLKIFYPRDKTATRQSLGIDHSLKVILFSAHGLDKNPRKGSDILIKTLQRLSVLKDTILLLAGEGGSSFKTSIPLPVKRLGYIENPETMAEIYSSADISIVPSIAENLPNNLLESMACCTPAVAFDAGGISDAVRHMQTGYLAKYGDSDDLANGIKMLLENANLRKELAINGRRLMEKEFDQEIETKRFEKLYIGINSKHEILNTK